MRDVFPVPGLTIKNISKSYGNTKVLDNVNIQIQDGEFGVIVGPSGSGKTTLLNIIAGFVKPDNGEIIMDGKILNQIPPRDRNIGMVFQEFGLFSHMTVRKNISFGLEIKKINKKDIGKKVTEIADTLKIGELLDKKPGILSGGEAQRVATGRTLVTNPLLFLFDEPMGNLDANLRREMVAEIKRLHLKLKKTFIYVTHDQEQALCVADRVIIMKEGRLLQEGHPRKIYNYPESFFVAEFFGIQSMNFIDGIIIKQENGSLFRGGGLTVMLKGYYPSEKTEVILGIRPEDIIIGNQVQEDGFGIISSLEFLGDIKQVYLTLEQEKPLIAIISPKERYGLGEKVKIKLKENKAFLFSKEHGGRLYP